MPAVLFNKPEIVFLLESYNFQIVNTSKLSQCHFQNG